MKRCRTQTVKIWLRDTLIALVIVLLITTFVARSLRVVGGSMLPTLQDGDIVIINKLAYYTTEPKRGDVIGFSKQNIEEDIVKRIVGMPGDVIDYREGVFYVNDIPVNNEQYYINKPGNIDYPYTVPVDSYFVLGDNYNGSVDSRYTSVGSVHKSDIIGKIEVRLWPIHRSSFIIK